MSILPLLIVGITAVAVACLAHDLTGTTMARSKFVFVTLATVGAFSISYIAV